MFILFVSLYLFSLYEPFLLLSDLLMCTGDSKPWNRGERVFNTLSLEGQTSTFTNL